MAKNNLTVGEALNQADETQRVRRASWPEGVHLSVQKGQYPIDGPAADMIDGVHPKHFDFSKEGTMVLFPDLWMNINHRVYAVQIAAADILAQDWEII